MECKKPNHISKQVKYDSDFKTCKAPIEEHKGTGESVAFIDIDSDTSGISECAVFNPDLPLKVRLRFKKKQLPWLTNWQHWGANEYVTALEPGTHPPRAISGTGTGPTDFYPTKGNKSIRLGNRSDT